MSDAFHLLRSLVRAGVPARRSLNLVQQQCGNDAWASEEAQGCVAKIVEETKKDKLSDQSLLSALLRLYVKEVDQTPVGLCHEDLVRISHEYCSKANPSECPSSKRVLEIGAGLGLNGIACATLASEVLLTDETLEVVNNIRRNLRMNRTAGCVSAAVLDIAEPYDEQLKVAEFQPEVLLGADICYEPTLTRKVVEMYSDVLKDKSQVGFLATTTRSVESFEHLNALLSRLHGHTVQDLTPQLLGYSSGLEYLLSEVGEPRVYKVSVS